MAKTATQIRLRIIRKLKDLLGEELDKNDKQMRARVDQFSNPKFKAKAKIICPAEEQVLNQEYGKMSPEMNDLALALYSKIRAHLVWDTEIIPLCEELFVDHKEQAIPGVIIALYSVDYDAEDEEEELKRVPTQELEPQHVPHRKKHWQLGELPINFRDVDFLRIVGIKVD